MRRGEVKRRERDEGKTAGTPLLLWHAWKALLRATLSGEDCPEYRKSKSQETDEKAMNIQENAEAKENEQTIRGNLEHRKTSQDFSLLRLFYLLPGVLAHARNVSIQGREAGGSQQVPGLSRLHCEILSQ